MLKEGDIGPLNFDPDEQMKRHVNETEKVIYPFE